VGRARATRGTVVGSVLGLVICVVVLAALVVQAGRGNAVVAVQLQATTKHNAVIDDAFYRCLDIQARSLVSPGEPVYFGPDNLSDWVTLTKGIGSWVTIASSPASAKADLSLRDDVTGRPACLGTVVVARTVGSHGVVRVGHGASVPGQGPPPAPPL
jgi:hypothetical protein